MAKINFEKQKEELSRMRAELERLNGRYDDVCKAAGINPAEKLDANPDNVPPEVAKAMESVMEEAHRAGRQAAASLEAETTEQTAPARRARRGAIAI